MNRIESQRRTFLRGKAEFVSIGGGGCTEESRDDGFEAALRTSPDRRLV